MKMIGRILLILAAALVVVGITVGLSRTSLGNSFFAGRERSVQRQPGGRAFTGSFPTGDFAKGSSGEARAADATTGRDRFDHGNSPGEFARGDRGGASLFGIIEVIRNFGIMSIVVAIVVLGARLMGGHRKSVSVELAGE